MNRASKYTPVFDDLWHELDAEVIGTPIQPPNANAVAERWVATVGRECLDHLLIAGRRQLPRVLHSDLRHDTAIAPTQASVCRPPEPSERCQEADPSAAAQQLHAATSSAASSTNTNAQHDNRPTSDTPRANYGFIQASDRLEGDFTAQDEANLVRLALLVSTALDALAQLHLPEYRAKLAEPGLSGRRRRVISLWRTAGPR